VGAQEGRLMRGGDSFGSGFTFIADNVHFLIEKSIDTLSLSAVAILISLVIAQPLAIWLGHLHRGSFLAINISNLGRALPTLAVLAIGITTPLGLGYAVSLLALVVLAVPVMVTNSYVAVDRVDPDAVEAARGMGMTAFQVITRVEIPLALPLIFAGIKTAATYVVATAPVSSIVGGGGLGDILYDKATYGTGGLVGASIIIALLALAVQGAFALLQRAVTPRGLKIGRGDAQVIDEQVVLAATTSA
jgi:osmoprotectant transport system permease protein